MFYNCNNIIDIDLSFFNSDYATNMEFIYANAFVKMVTETTSLVYFLIKNWQFQK